MRINTWTSVLPNFIQIRFEMKEPLALDFSEERPTPRQTTTARLVAIWDQFLIQKHPESKLHGLEQDIMEA